MEMERDMKSVMRYWMEGEISNFIQTLMTVHLSLCYTYFAAKLIPKGAKRLFSLLPVVYLFFLIPLNLHSAHLGGTTAFFLAWLANFKLLLLAFGHGPLSHPSISLPRFLALACLPINVQNTPHHPQNGHFQESPDTKSGLYPQNGHFQESPDTKSGLYPQNGHFQENPDTKSLEKSGLYPQNGHFQENPNTKSLKKSSLYPQNEHFQENPGTKSLEKSGLYPQNGHFQENPDTKSLKKSGLYHQNGHFQENPDTKSLEKSDLHPQNGSFKENSYPKPTKNNDQTRDFQGNPNPKKGDMYPQNGNFTENPYPKSTKNGQKRGFQETPNPKSSETGKIASQKNGHFVEASKSLEKFVTYATKPFLMSLMIIGYSYSEHMHPTIILFINFIHIYFYLEIIQALMAAMTRGLLGLELEPQFKEPYFSSSLQNFWGGRWNLMVNRILRPTVYTPVLRLSTRLLGRRWAAFPAVMSTFAVSGLMHELMFYYLGRVKPTWEITCFFLLHGACLALEIAAKKALNGRFQPPRILAAAFSVGFVLITGFWLFFPQLLRCRALPKAFAEYDKFNSFLRDVGGALTSAFQV
ncbi:PREDICTED: acyl-CoA--sterol O-acyltransferase 1-like [Ipomoea nil]|uniref:acyl-CoA--sterol O-acyltransferase 1-like n=1 Tax=Ipomoea nil TaxID=35883 RepID=UPI000901A5BA|nr:PREDICTED: acyl-CoA--sterol O-acyltransferase 1-like [Ipomoea nil]